MKISWGLGITIVIITFTTFLLLFVFFAFNQEVNLVRDDYYEAELKFNEKMDILKRTNELTEKITISLEPDYIVLNFPLLSNFSNITGEILLYRPSNRKLDMKLPIQLDSKNSQLINTEHLSNGMWKIQIDWYADTVAFFNEKIIMVE